MPIRAQGLHHVDVAKEEHRLLRRLAGGAIADDEIHLARIGPQQLHVFRRKPGVEEALLHRCGGGGHVALGRIGGVDFDQLLEDRVRLGAVGFRCGRQSALRNGGHSKASGEGKCAGQGKKVEAVHERILRCGAPLRGNK